MNQQNPESSAYNQQAAQQLYGDIQTAQRLITSDPSPLAPGKAGVTAHNIRTIKGCLDPTMPSLQPN